MAITNFVPQIWAPALLEAYHANAVVTPTVTHEYEGIVTKGSSVKITSVATPSIVDYLAASHVLTPQTLADSAVTLNINQQKAFGFYVDDVDALQAAGSFDAVTADAGQALVEDAESYLLGQMIANGTNANTGTAVAITSDTLAYNAVLAVRTALTKAKVPFNDRFLVVNPDFASFLLNSTSKLTNVAYAGDSQALRSALLGRLLGFDVLESPLLNPAKPTCIGYQGNGAAFVSQMDKVEALRATDRFDDIVRGLHVYGAGVIRPTSIQTYVSA